MSAADFLDTNVLIYLFDETDGRKRSIASELVRGAMASGEACISFQVVQETLQVITRKLDPPASAAEASRLLDDVLAPLWTVSPTSDLYRRGLAPGASQPLLLRRPDRRRRARGRLHPPALRGPAARPAHRAADHREPLRGALSCHPSYGLSPRCASHDVERKRLSG